MNLFIVLFIMFFISCNSVLKGQTSENSFDFKEQLFGDPSSLSIFVVNINNGTGEVTINGGDSRRPNIPFTFDWGDGSISEGFFERKHIYSDLTQNYLVQVTAHYENGKTGSAVTMARFTSKYSISKVSLPNDVNVEIPDHNIALSSRMQGYGIPSSLTYFDDSYFTQYSRSDIEYILTVGAVIQKDFANNNLYRVNDEFKQVLLRDPSAGGMYSLWYTDPISFGVGDYGFEGTVGYSSFFHEMGHNVTLNSPADYYYGGKIDGCANAIYSESMAQIFQHATIYEIINLANTYGLNEEFVFDIKNSGISSINLVRNSYERYVESGMPFSSWNPPNNPNDRTFDTFMTIAYKFFIYAENEGLGYRTPLKRMMELLQTFDEESRIKYDQYNNTEMAETFRATLMVTALSHAFSLDLRNEFRELNFPISDEIYNELLAGIPPVPVNLPPTADSQSITTNENVSIKIVLSASDPEGDTLTFKINAQPSHGSISGNPPELIYKPNYGFGGEDSFTFIANDGKSDSDPMTIKIIVNLIPNPVDINRDGIVNILDLVIIGKYYGKEDFPLDNNPDANRDHKVDNKDFEIVQKDFGKKL
jgi:hypothetical protein